MRGVYLASSTQTGAQIDRLMQSMATSFGLPAPRQPIFAGVTKTYFLTRLLKSVVFGEAGLVSSDFRARQRTRRVAQVAATGAAIGILGLGVAWGATYFHTVRQITDVSDRLADFRRLSSTIPVQDIADNDMRRVAEALDTLRGAAASLGPSSLSGIDLDSANRTSCCLVTMSRTGAHSTRYCCRAFSSGSRSVSANRASIRISHSRASSCT